MSRASYVQGKPSIRHDVQELGRAQQHALTCTLWWSCLYTRLNIRRESNPHDAAPKTAALTIMLLMLLHTLSLMPLPPPPEHDDVPCVYCHSNEACLAAYTAHRYKHGHHHTPYKHVI